MSYNVYEFHCHGCIYLEQFLTLKQAKQYADDCQDRSNQIPDDGWGSHWIVRRSGWYPSEPLKILYATTPDKTCNRPAKKSTKSTAMCNCVTPTPTDQKLASHNYCECGELIS